MDSTGSGQGPVLGYCENDTETSGSQRRVISCLAE